MERQETKYGTNSKSVLILRNELCKHLRARLIKLLKITWPYRYDGQNDTFQVEMEKGLTRYSDDDFEKLTLSLGPCLSAERSQDIPIITHRFTEQTSQGKVVMANLNLKGAKIVVIIKSNQISTSQKALWLSEEKQVRLKTSQASYIVICKAYMDALCSIALSRMVEKNIIPHFPLCYTTSVNRVGFKRSRYEEIKGSLCQTIWMEFLAQSMYDVLKSSSDHRVWWSALFQVIATLCVAQKKYDFVHNDLHSKNVRVKPVPEKTKIYYETDDGVILEVPTFGFLFVIIDFGRSFIRLDEDGLVSSVFYNHGECSTIPCDNMSIDIIRLISSLDDTFKVIKSSTERQIIREFAREVCRMEDGNDYLQLLRLAPREKFNHMIEVFPRKFCKDGIPKRIVPKFYSLYRIDKIPANIVPFKLDLK